MNPIQFIGERKNKILNHKDKFKILLGKSDYYIYVEDKDKGGFYEALLEKIYRKKFEVFDNLGGKRYVINHYYEMLAAGEITDNQIFLLDRDYEYVFKELNFESLSGKSFLELEREENIRILERTNIENYLLTIDYCDYEKSYEKLITAIRSVTTKKESSIKEILTIEIYIDIVNKMLELSYLFMISLCFDGTFKKKGSHICFNELCYTEYSNGHLERLKTHFEKVKYNYCDLVPNIDNMTFEEFRENFRGYFNKNIDMDMKQLITQLTNCVIERSKKEEFKTINKLDENSLKSFLLIYQEEELIEELKNILKI